MGVDVIDISPQSLGVAAVPLQVTFWRALGRMRVVLAGELDLGSSTRLADECLRLIDEGWDIELDLGALTFADVAGFSAIAAIREHASACGQDLAIIGPTA